MEMERVEQMLFPFDWNHPYSWRTNLRSALPRPLCLWFVKGEDCKAEGADHVWYKQDDDYSACYHCRVVLKGQLWEKGQ